MVTTTLPSSPAKTDSHSLQTVEVGSTRLDVQLAGRELISLGRVRVDGVDLRNASTRFLPWFDTYEGDIFRRFEFQGVTRRGAETVIATRAYSDPDAYPFRERRDSSGDPCFYERGWDAAPLQADLRICLKPAEQVIDGRTFRGFTYWHEFEGPSPIHRLLDRQTWEVGGSLEDVTLVCRNWLTPPRYRLGRKVKYSTVGLDQWSGLLPGNMWARWALLQGFDLQYGPAGALVGQFDRLSLVRTVMETAEGEDTLRILDLHLFENGRQIQTNPKTILHCPDPLDDTDALNLWTRLQDREAERVRTQFSLPQESPPAVVFHDYHWVSYHLDRSYEKAQEVAGEFGGEILYIDSVWENHQALTEEMATLLPKETLAGTTLEKFKTDTMCGTFDFKVAARFGGEEALQRLCNRAARQGLKVISWFGLHVSTSSGVWINANRFEPARMGHGACSVFAARESGRHPDTGYPFALAPINLNAPVFNYVKDSLIDVCKRTGLGGYFWDSFCNMGWWPVDYSKGDMRPQFEKVMELYREMVSAGLYLMPESLVTFSNHSCLEMHSGNIYTDDLLGYSYNTNISLWEGAGDPMGLKHRLDTRMITGEVSTDILFACVAHKRIPVLLLHRVPRETWNPQAAERIKEILGFYRKHRHLMQRRTVLKEGAGVLWEDGAGEQAILFSFRDQAWPLGDHPQYKPQNASDLKAHQAYLLRRTG